MVFDLQFSIIAAPMAGITDRPFRAVLRELNPAMPIMTEMISCHSITAKGGGRNDDEYFGGNVGAQIFGADPAMMAAAAKILQDRGAAWIDINMGCPVPKVATRAGAGAFLMRDHKLAGEIMLAVVRAVKIPVSIKTRLGWDEAHLDSDDLLRIASESGVSFATVHARTRAQGYSGNARWEEARAARQRSRSKIPVVFNGDIKSASDVESVRKLGADGAMIGRAMLGNPWLDGIVSPVCGGRRRGDIVAGHFESMISYYGEAGARMFRKHLAWYASGRKGAAEFRRRANQISDATEMRKAIVEFFNS